MPAPRFVRRGDWAVGPSGPSLRTHTIERITLHHTAVPLDERTTPERLRAYQRYHQQQGWSDIAYHLLIGSDGRLYEGRSFETRGDSATGYDTAGHLLVALDGEFTHAPPAESQLAALADLLAWALRHYELAWHTVRGHHAYAATACPGEQLTLLLADGSLRERVESQFSTGTRTDRPDS